MMKNIEMVRGRVKGVFPCLVVMVLMLAGDFCLRADDSDMEHLIFEVLSEEDRTVSVRGKRLEEYLDTLRIPPVVTLEGKEYAVTAIAPWGFDQYSKLGCLIVPGSVSGIMDYSFLSSQINSIVFEREEPLEYIGESAFCNSKIREFDFRLLPSDPSKMGTYIFAGDQFDEVIWPDHVPEVPDFTFEEASIKHLKLPPTLRKIGKYAFCNCWELPEVEIPDDVEIGEEAFSWEYLGTRREMTTFSLGEGCTIGRAALTSVMDCGSEVFRVPPRTKLLYGALSRLKYEDNYFMENVTTFELPADIDLTEGDRAITSYRMLIWWYPEHYDERPIIPFTIIYHTDDPTWFDSNPFDDETYEDGVLYVEPGGMEKARQTHPWNRFKTILPIGGGSVQVEEINAEPLTEQAADVYDLQGAFVGSSTQGLSPGLYLVRQGQGFRKVMVGK